MMYVKIVLATVCLGIFYPGQVFCQAPDSPVEYMEYLSSRDQEMSEKYLSYMSEVAHGNRARKMEKRRQELRRHWPEGKLRRLWNRESGRVSQGLRRAWRIITGHGLEPGGAGA